MPYRCLRAVRSPNPAKAGPVRAKVDFEAKAADRVVEKVVPEQAADSVAKAADKVVAKVADQVAWTPLKWRLE